MSLHNQVGLEEVCQALLERFIEAGSAAPGTTIRGIELDDDDCPTFITLHLSDGTKAEMEITYPRND